MSSIQDDIEQVETRIQELEDMLEGISLTHVMFPALFLELQELKDSLQPLKELARKYNL
jgi:prefoldin subunit 5